MPLSQRAVQPLVITYISLENRHWIRSPLPNITPRVKRLPCSVHGTIRDRNGRRNGPSMTFQKMIMPGSLFLLVTQMAFAGTPYDTRYRAMRAACLDRHWSEEKVTILSPNTAFHDYRVGRAEELAGDATMNLFRTPVKLFWTLEKESTGRKTGAEKRLDALITELKGFAAAKNLNEWQRACLTKCVSAHMIDTVGSTQSEFLIQPARILEKGEGVCKQYAMLGEFVGRALDVQTKLISDGFLEKEGHVFLRVKINGKSFYSEPQNGRCEFFRTE